MLGDYAFLFLLFHVVVDGPGMLDCGILQDLRVDDLVLEV